MTILALTFSSAAAALTSAAWSVLSFGSVAPLSCMQTPKSTNVGGASSSASSVSFADTTFVPRLRLLRTATVGGGVGVGVGAIVGVGSGVGTVVAPPLPLPLPLPPPSPEANSASCVSFVEKIFVPRLRLLRTPGLGGGVGLGVGAVVGVGGGVGFGVGCGVGFRVGFGVGFGVGPFDAVGPGVGSEVACAVGCGVGKSVGGIVAIAATTRGDIDTCTDTVPPTAAATEAANGPLELSMSEVIWLGSTLVCPGGN